LSSSWTEKTGQRHKQRRTTRGIGLKRRRKNGSWTQTRNQKSEKRTEEKKPRTNKKKPKTEEEQEDNAGAYKGTETELWPVIHHASVSWIRKQARRTKTKKSQRTRKLRLQQTR
jgi:hypothetical protein